MLLHGQPCEKRLMLDRVESLYKRAVYADPANANNFSNYGLFLAEVRPLKTLSLNSVHVEAEHSCIAIAFKLCLSSHINYIRPAIHIVWRLFIQVHTITAGLIFRNKWVCIGAEQKQTTMALKYSSNFSIILTKTLRASGNQTYCFWSRSQ